MDSTWLENPVSNDYTTFFNWDTGDVPASAGDTATFGQSNTTALTISGSVFVDSWTFNANAGNYVVSSDQEVDFLGDGIVVNGGAVQIINLANGSLQFRNTSSAGSASIANHHILEFRDNSTAGNATIVNDDFMDFEDASTAGSATITNNGILRFVVESDAGNATIINNESLLIFTSAADASITTRSFGDTLFSGTSTAGNATLIVDANGTLDFQQSSTSANAKITNNGDQYYRDDSTAGSADIINTGFAASLVFFNSSTAGNASIINANSLVLSFYSTSSAGSAQITNEDLILFNNSSTGGSATIANAATGGIYFSDNSTAASAMIANDGALMFLDGSSAGSATIINSGLVEVVDSASLDHARLINGAAGVLDISGMGLLVTTVGSIEGEGHVNLGTRTLFAGVNNLSTEFSGVISGAGGQLGKYGTGTLILSGTNTYTGRTIVAEGRLIVNGSIASSPVLDVIAAGTLGGDGTVGSMWVGGTVAPGNFIGTLNAAGSVTFYGDSVYELDINSAGQSDLIDATGIATLNGGTVEVVPLPDFVLDTQYTILTAAGGLGGTFNGVNFASSSLFLTPTLTYGANDVFLTIAQTADFDSAALTPNQIAAAGGAQSLGAGNLFNAIALLGSEAEARNAFDAISGEIHASAKTALIEDSRFVREAANTRLRADLDDVGFWAHGFGATGRTSGDGNAAKFDRSIGGLLVGADGEVLDNWRFGLLTGYSHSNFDVDDRASSGSADNYHLGAYGGTQWQNWALRFGGAYSRHDIDIGRTAAFTGFSDGLSSSYSASTGQLFGELGYGMDVGAAHLEPFANLAWVNHATDDFTEVGGAAALTSVDSNTDATFATLGLRVEAAVALGEVNAKVKGMVGYRHAFADEPTSTHSFVAGGDAFTVAGVPIASDTLVLDAGVDLDIAPNVALGLAYSGQFGSGIRDHAARAHLNVKF